MEEQELNDIIKALKHGYIILCVKNKDGSLSPMMMDKEIHGAFIAFMGVLTKDNPLRVIKGVKLKTEH